MTEQGKVFNFSNEGFGSMRVPRIGDDNFISNTYMLISIKDLKTNKFTPPFIARNYEDAKRQASNVCNYTQSLMNKFPQDFELYYISDFDEDYGKCCLRNPELICSFSDLVSDDTIKYDELKKEIKTYNFQVQNICKEFDEKAALYDKKLRELSYLEDTLKTKYENKDSVDVYPCIPEKAKKLTLKKRTFLDKLFGE